MAHERLHHARTSTSCIADISDTLFELNELQSQ
jgi:hypothetical protein